MNRVLNLFKLLESNSHFLFGARGTGKSYLIKEQLKDKVDYIDLLRSKTFLALQSDPSELESMISKKWVAIDEIQRIPELLNEVHRLIEDKGIKFLLTGSSARKLKRTGVNLLAGRAYKSEMMPLTWKEISAEQEFNLDKYLLFGGLPKAILGSDPSEYLYSYVETYLKEEIQAEALVRNLANYHRFLECAARKNSEMVNFTSVASDAQLPPNTVRDYYQILQDTLIGEMLPSWAKSKKRKAIQTAKFYFFDMGVVNSLRGVEFLDRNSDLYRNGFEHFIYLELKAYLSYNKIRKPLTYWRSKNGYEVDFVIGDSVAIEVKSSKRVSKRDHKGMVALLEEDVSFDHAIIVSQDVEERNYDYGISHLYFEKFLKELWAGKII
jgi:predicted AAA+ superfamily ATPase